jgi:hypothetical protein
VNAERDRKTIRAMVRIYCRGHHQAEEAPCPECTELLNYALDRVERCPWGARRTTCSACPIHCYTRRMQERIRSIMSYAGPRMLYRHPVLAFFHLLELLKGPPEPPEEDEIRE